MNGIEKVKNYHYLGHKWHVVQKIEDSGKVLYVVKRWRKSKQRWHYEVESESMLKYILKNWSE